MWPAGTVGSITHTRLGEGCHTAAAIGQTDAMVAIGIDAEFKGSISPHHWPTILTADELDAIRLLPAPLRGLNVLHRWCVKEAFLKARGAPLQPTTISANGNVNNDKAVFDWTIRCPSDKAITSRLGARTINFGNLILAAVTFER